MNQHSDAYTFLAEKHGFGNSQPYLRVLRFLMTPEQAGMVALLPGSPEEVTQKSGLKLATVRENLEALHRKGVVVPRDYKTSGSYMFCKYAERLWEVSESLLAVFFVQRPGPNVHDQGHLVRRVVMLTKLPRHAVA